MEWYAKLTNIRNAYSVLRTGDIVPITVNDTNKADVMAYSRNDKDNHALIAINRKNTDLKGIVLDSNAPSGTTLTNTLNPSETYEVGNDGKVTVNIPKYSGVVLVASYTAVTVNTADLRDVYDDAYIVEPVVNASLATKAVRTAEVSQTQIDVDAAMILVNVLPESDTKTDLLRRLKKVQNIIDASKALEKATKAVEKAEASKTQAKVDAAMALVNVLPNSDIKNNLLGRLNKVQETIDAAKALEEAIKAVEKAEASKNKADIEAAKALVTALTDEAKRNDLLNRLNQLPKTGGSIMNFDILALGGLLFVVGVSLLKRKKERSSIN